jgi:hypothetical protein
MLIQRLLLMSESTSTINSLTMKTTRGRMSSQSMAMIMVKMMRQVSMVMNMVELALVQLTIIINHLKTHKLKMIERESRRLNRLLSRKRKLS